MSSGWKDKICELMSRMLEGNGRKESNKATESADKIIPTANSSTAQGGVKVSASLGIDFGTRFTKVVLQLPRLDKRVPLSLGWNGRALHPANLAIHEGVAFPPDLEAPADASRIEYLKMRLLVDGEAEFGDGPPVARDQISAFAAFYLAGVIRLAQAAALKSGHFPRGAEISWSAQVGVAAKTFDSEDLGLFEEATAVAWAWKDEAPTPRSIEDLVSAYAKTRLNRLSREDSPIIVAPELVAAISHIASRSDAPEGLYALLDIGGGTLDGTVFLLKRNPSPAVDILAAQVERLGTVAIARKICGSRAGVDAAETRLIEGRLTASDQRQLRYLEPKVAGVLRKIIAEAVQKCPGANFVTFGQSDLDTRIGHRGYRSIPILLAGGGGASSWYKKAFENLDLHQWAVAEIKTRIIPKPIGWIDEDYPRFVVANGLSNRDLQIRQQYRLPTDIPIAPPPPEWCPPFDSPNSKDIV